MIDPTKYKFAELWHTGSPSHLYTIRLYTHKRPLVSDDKDGSFDENIRLWATQNTTLYIPLHPSYDTKLLFLAKYIGGCKNSEELDSFRDRTRSNGVPFPIECVEFPENKGQLLFASLNIEPLLKNKHTTTTPTTKPEVITMCGSTRFADLMAAISWEFEKTGKIVLRVNYVPAWYVEAEGWTEHSHGAEQSGLKEELDELHKRKIDMSDRVFVCNYRGYIGDSTRAEIQYAEEVGKPIHYIDGPKSELHGTIRNLIEWYDAYLHSLQPPIPPKNLQKT